MQKTIRSYFLLSILLLFGLSIAAKNVIFDLGGVLIDTNKFACLKYIGAINLAQYSLHLKISPFSINNQIQKIFFATLEKIAQLHNLEAQNPQQFAYDDKGNILPYLMRAWMQGTISNHQIRALINKSIILHPEWFNHLSERRIIENLARMIFTPQQFVATRKICSAGISFIKRCKKHGHKIYVLSNWDSESFALLKAQNLQLFGLFDGIVISANVNALKPNQPIYQALLSQYQLDPEQCWFIDDQQENISAAQKVGINAVLYTSNFKKLAQKIQKLVHSKSATRREKRKNKGIIVSNTKTTSNAIIDGENISPTDSTDDNLPPANA
jgi:putative hydrolase of the HAD superfamily